MLTGHDLREWRERQGLSQLAAGKRLGAAQSTMSTAEGKADAPLGKKLAVALALALEAEQAPAPAPVAEGEAPAAPESPPAETEVVQAEPVTPAPVEVVSPVEETLTLVEPLAAAAPVAEQVPEFTLSELSRQLAARAGGAVLANMHKGRDEALRVWAEAEGRLVRIDRGTPWGNPYKVGKDGDRAEVCRKFAEHFAERPDLHAQLGDLRGKVLACWCYPAQCHGETLLRALEALPAGPVAAPESQSQLVETAAPAEAPSAPATGLPAEVLELRERHWTVVQRHSEPGALEVLRRLAARQFSADWQRWLPGLVPPVPRLTAPNSPTTLGQYTPIGGDGLRGEVLLRPSLVVGKHPAVKPGPEFLEGRLRFVEDVLLHESVHAYMAEVTGTTERAYKGHGPVFAAKCNEIGEALGLPPVRPAKARGPLRDLPSCAEWPHNVRPEGYYLGALAEPAEDAAAGDDSPDAEQVLLERLEDWRAAGEALASAVNAYAAAGRTAEDLLHLLERLGGPGAPAGRWTWDTPAGVVVQTLGNVPATRDEQLDLFAQN